MLLNFWISAHLTVLIYINTQFKLLDDHVSGSENLEMVFYKLSLVISITTYKA